MRWRRGGGEGESSEPGRGEGQPDSLTQLQLTLGHILASRSPRPRSVLSPLWIDFYARDLEEPYTLATLSVMFQRSYWDFVGIPQGSDSDRFQALQALSREQSGQGLDQKSFIEAGRNTEGRMLRRSIYHLCSKRYVR